MAEIFVSYRRDDTGILCERVTGRLTARFGEKRVFRDATAIFIGSKWEKTLRDALEDCYVVIALIGAHWLDARDAQGQLRLFDPHDFVRMELATALAQRKRIVPVLANGARMPLPHELPPDLAPLAHIPALVLRPEPHFDSDIQAIMEMATPGVRRRLPYPGIMLNGLIALLALATTLLPTAVPGLYDSGGPVAETLFYFYVSSNFILLMGFMFVIRHSIYTRAWVWLTVGILALSPVAFMCAWWIESFFNRDLISISSDSVSLDMLAQTGSIALALAFGAYGPRSLSRLATPQQQLRPVRWIAGACSSLIGLLFICMLLINEVNLDGLPEASYTLVQATFDAIFVIAVLSSLAGIAVSVGTLVRQRRWWLSAELVFAMALTAISSWASVSFPASSDVAFGALLMGLAISVVMLDFVALRSDHPPRAHRSKRSSAVAAVPNPVAEPANATLPYPSQQSPLA